MATRRRTKIAAEINRQNHQLWGGKILNRSGIQPLRTNAVCELSGAERRAKTRRAAKSIADKR